MRRQPTFALFTIVRPVDDLFQKVPMEPSGQHPQPDVIRQPTRRSNLYIGLPRDRHDRKATASPATPQQTVLTSTNALSERHCCATRAERSWHVGADFDLCGAVQEMEGLWPSGVALRWEASNHLVLRWLKTVVVSVEEKAA